MNKLDAFVVAAVNSLSNQTYRSSSTIATDHGYNRHHRKQIDQDAKRLEAFKALSFGTETHDCQHCRITSDVCALASLSIINTTSNEAVQLFSVMKTISPSNAVAILSLTRMNARALIWFSSSDPRKEDGSTRVFVVELRSPEVRLGQDRRL